MTRYAGDPCDWPGCDHNKTLLRVNETGKPGVFMCREHAERVQQEGFTDWYHDPPKRNRKG